MNKDKFVQAIESMKILDSSNDIDLDYVYSQFEIYRNELIEWNKLLNLTRITDKEDIYKKHFLDSLSVFQFEVFYNYVNNLSDNVSLSVLDIGTGAGFPAIPIKILMPSLDITLMDSLKKRVGFLKHIANKLHLDMECLHGRAEDFGQNMKYRESFNIVVSRAVANFSTLLEYAIPFVKVNGFFIAYKGSAYDEEIKVSKNALEKLGSQIEKVIDVNISDANFCHKLIVVRKLYSTNLKYPRRAGIPAKKPL